MFMIKEVILEEEQQLLISFLSKNNLEYEYDIDFSILVYDNDQLIATGSLANNIMKCFLVIEKYKGKKKIIGICLGFQQILFSEGASIVEQNKIYHGFQSEVLVNKSSKLFSKGQKFKVGRYHSLKLKEPFKAENFDITMRCVISGAAMSFENNIDKIYGFQFHPESFLTLNGKLLIKKILSA